MWKPWKKRDHTGLDRATEAVNMSTRELGRIEQRGALIDELVERARVAHQLQQPDALDRKIRDALGGTHP